VIRTAIALLLCLTPLAGCVVEGEGPSPTFTPTETEEDVLLRLAWEKQTPSDQATVCDAYLTLGAEVAYGFFADGFTDTDPPGMDSFRRFFDSHC